jgi:hypothetical protein
VQSIAPKLSSRRAQRWLLWAAALVLAAGIGAVLIVFVGNTGSKEVAPFSDQPVDIVKKPKTVPLPPEARIVAGRFVLTAVQRKNLDEAWNLVGPGIKQGMTYKEWLKGDIAVIPFFGGIKLAPIHVLLSTKNYALLEIILLPKAAKVKPEIFQLELIHRGKGPAGRWLVNSWAPRSRPAIPSNPNAS